MNISVAMEVYNVNQRRAPLVLRWVTVSGFNSRWGTFISACNQPPRSTQPGHPFVGRRNEYQPKGGDALRLGSKGRYGSCVGGRLLLRPPSPPEYLIGFARFMQVALGGPVGSSCSIWYIPATPLTGVNWIAKLKPNNLSVNETNVSVAMKVYISTMWHRGLIDWFFMLFFRCWWHMIHTCRYRFMRLCA